MSGVLIFELAVILITVGLWYYMKKTNHKQIVMKMLVMFIGVLLFEIMSEPMWKNNLLNSWAYIFNDVSWIITLGWVIIFLVSILLVDYIFKNLEEKKKFWLYLLFVTVITTPIEVALLSTGVRSYATELTSTMSGISIPFTGAPIEIILILPILAALIIPFYKVAIDVCKLNKQ